MKIMVGQNKKVRRLNKGRNGEECRNIMSNDSINALLYCVQILEVQYQWILYNSSAY